MHQQTPIGSGFGPTTTATEVLNGINLHGKLAVVTGGYSGLGLETTRALARAGASVLVPARDDAQAHRAVTDLPGVEVCALDLAEPASIARLADHILGTGRGIDILVNNAGVMAVPLRHDDRGFEAHLAINYFGHVELTRRLWPALAAGEGARIVNVTSRAYRFSRVEFDDPNYAARDYDKWAAYGQSMTAKTLFTVELDARGGNDGIRAFAVHPGTIMTNLSRHLSRAELVAVGAVAEDGTVLHPSGYKSVAEGAATTVWAATSPLLDGRGGVYLDDVDIAPLTDSSSDLYGPGIDAWALDPDTAQRWWQQTETLLGHRFATGLSPATQHGRDARS